jgi:hypothetical protein
MAHDTEVSRLRCQPYLFLVLTGLSACAGTIDDFEPQEGEEIDVLPNAEDDQTPLSDFHPYSAGGTKAFPSAEGFGAYARGGRGGRAIEVTTLADSGPGSLRACAEATGPRTCVFRVGGTINLNSDLVVREPNSFLTIAGQTAPGGGVQLKNWGLAITRGAHDVVVRYLKVRKGTDQSPEDINNDCNGILVWGSSAAGPTHNVIVDHASVSWICDDSVQTYSRATDVTVQWTLIGEGLTAADYRNRTGKAANSKGGAVAGTGTWRRTYHHNLYVHTGTRNPYAKGQATAVPVIDWRNNLVYNWNACHGNVALGENHEHRRQGNDASIHVNFVGNVYVAGPNTPSTSSSCWFGRLGGQSSQVFLSDNQTPFCTNCSSFAAMRFYAQPAILGSPPSTFVAASDSQFRVHSPFAVPSVTTTPSASLQQLLVDKVGASLPARDALDQRLIAEMQARTGDLGRNGIPWPVLATGVSPVDSDHDGMPNSWETAHGLNPNNAGDGASTTANGYTNLENYLNELAGDNVP